MDYSDRIENITFEIGDTTKIVNIPITNDCLNESSENFNMILRRFDTNVRLISPLRSVGIITDTGELSYYNSVSSVYHCVEIFSQNLIYGDQCVGLNSWGYT